MSARSGVRRWLARLAAAAALAAIVSGAFSAAAESRRMFRYARRHAGAPLELAQDRLFGRDYMSAIREVRRRIGEGGTVHFIDDAARQQGWSYFALYHLAPRRLSRLGTADELERGRLERQPPRQVEIVVRIPSDGAPPTLIAANELRRGGKGARKARP